VTAAYRDQGTTKDTVTTYVYALTASLTGSSPVQRVTLPLNVTGGAIHIFDIELAPQ
jgi:hypothetical protein